MAAVRGRLVAWWRELLSGPVPLEPAPGWFWWEYRLPPAEPDENEDQDERERHGVGEGRLLVRRDGSWRA
jgi:hypothetical protein